MPRGADGKWSDREHDPTGDQSPAEAQRYLLDRGQRGGGIPTASRRGFRSVGRDPDSHAGRNGEGPTNRLALDATRVPGRTEGTRGRRRGIDANINEETI